MSNVDTVLDLARRELGYAENPPGSNHNRYSLALDRSAQPWCADFLVWVFRQAGVKLPSESAYTPTLANAFRRTGRFGDRPEVGALVFYRWPGMGRIAHVGVVEHVRADGTIIAIEGNTDQRGGRTGGKVMRQVRRANIAGYGYPAYPDQVRPAAKPQRAETTGASIVSSLPILRRGDRGESVRVLQGLLIAARHTGVAVDGEFGNVTDFHVREFQRARGLKIDGVVGPATWRRLLRL